VPPERVIRLLDNVFEESGLLSRYGIRAISAWHREHPFTVHVGGTTACVDHEPGESTTASIDTNRARRRRLSGRRGGMVVAAGAVSANGAP